MWGGGCVNLFFCRFSIVRMVNNPDDVMLQYYAESVVYNVCMYVRAALL